MNVEEITKHINDFINENNINEGEYVIIVFEKTNYTKNVRFVYKNVNDFNQRYDEDIKEIEDEKGIRVEWFTFD